MNYVHDFICSFYSNIHDCPASIFVDNRFKIAAAAGIAFGALLFSFAQGYYRDPRMIEVFERNWRMLHPRKPFPKMYGLISEQDAHLVHSLFEKWRFHSGYNLFDLLGLEIRDKWKIEANEKDLADFGHLMGRLPVILFSYPEQFNAEAKFSSELKEVRSELQKIGAKVPNEAREEFELLIKLLGNFKKAKVLATSALQLFQHGGLLDRGAPNPNHLLDLMEYGNSLFGGWDHLVQFAQEKRWADLSVAIDKKNGQLKPTLGRLGDERKGIALLASTLFLTRFKETIDEKLLGTNVLFHRLILNSRGPEDYEGLSGKQKHLFGNEVKWCEKQLNKYLARNFSAKLDESLKRILKINRERLFSEAPLNKDLMKTGFRTLASECHSKDNLGELEKEIERRLLFLGKELEIDPEKEHHYGIHFKELVRLYQIVHDIRHIKDPTKDTLQGQSIPDSLSRLATQSDALEQSKLQAAAQSFTPLALARPIPSTSLRDFIEEDSHEQDRKVKIKTRKSPIPSLEEEDKEVKGESPLPSSMVSKEAELPYFPRRNVKPREVFQILINHGFVIESVEGSHYKMGHAISGVKTTVPFHSEPLKPGTLDSIREAFYNSQRNEE